MNFSRHTPSKRYQELVRLYREMHERGEPFLGLAAGDTFPGASLLPQAPRIHALIRATGSANILDYGSGKGRQYAARDVMIPGDGRWESIQEYWDVDYIQCYDPGYPPYALLPEGRFDGVIATDVLEHCPQEDIGWILSEIFGFADRFVFASIACFSARKRLPNGENAHCTVQSPDWWRGRFREAAVSRGGIRWEIWLHSLTHAQQGPAIAEQRFCS